MRTRAEIEAELDRLELLAGEESRGLTIPHKAAGAAEHYAEVLRWVLGHGAPEPSARVVRRWREAFVTNHGK